LVFGGFGKLGDYISIDDVVFSDAAAFESWQNAMFSQRSNDLIYTKHLLSSGRIVLETKTGTYFHRVYEERIVLFQIIKQGNSFAEVPVLVGERSINGGIGTVRHI
jgi:hypothetical protein